MHEAELIPQLKLWIPSKLLINSFFYILTLSVSFYVYDFCAVYNLWGHLIHLYTNPHCLCLYIRVIYSFTFTPLLSLYLHINHFSSVISSINTVSLHTLTTSLCFYRLYFLHFYNNFTFLYNSKLIWYCLAVYYIFVHIYYFIYKETMIIPLIFFHILQ